MIKQDQPQDQTFVKAVELMTPKLNAKFYKKAKDAGIREDRRLFAEDLTALTILEALINSRKITAPSIDEYVNLLKIKANNVWAEYWRSNSNRFHLHNISPIDMPWKEQDIKSESDRLHPKLEWLLDNTEGRLHDILKLRLQNHQVNEIAKIYGTSPSAITMEIQRLKKKIRDRK